MRQLPSGTVTFLFSDIEGSTKLLDELGSDAYAEALAEHRRLMREAFTAQGGVEVDTQGDGFFVAFPEAAGALAAAAQAQAALAEGPIRVRMGIHSGEPLLTAEGYVGIDVHRGARVMSAGHGGQVLISAETQALVGGDFALVELGRHRLKDLTEPQPLYQLGDGEFPPLKTLYQTNLPVQPTPLVGREAELATVLGLLSSSRLVTLTGAGGSGKTRLGLQAAAELVDDYKDGIWWVPLAALRDPALLEPTIAQVVGATDGLAEHLRSKHTLLLLDNFEQLVEGAPLVGDLLAATPDVRILVTSRERLALSAEQEYQVPTLVPAEALALFTVRARQLQPEFESDEHVAEICRRLDGLPLALELAAARVKVLSSEQILERLGRSLELLTAGSRDAPERQRTLRATIEWSYELLTPDERQLFARLAVFAGSFDLEAAEAVADADIDDLAALVDKSLLRRTADGRFFMLETIREFSRERLAESDKADETTRRQIEIFADLVERLEPQLRGHGQEDALETLDREHDNIRAAMDYAAELRLAEAEAQLAGAAWYFWYVRGHIAEGVTRLECALRHEQLGASPRARLHEGLTVLEAVRGNHEAAREHADTSLRMRRELGDPDKLLRALANRAGLAGHEGDLNVAEALQTECAELALQVGNEWFRALALSNLAWVAVEKGHYERAVLLGTEGVGLLHELGDRQSEGAGSISLAHAELRLGRHEAGIGRLAEFLEQHDDLRIPEAALWAVELLAGAVIDESPERSARLFGATAAIAEDLGYTLSTKYQRLRESARAHLEELLEPEALAEAEAEGASMSLDEAVRYALDSVAVHR
jgi:predicted ATPase